MVRRKVIASWFFRNLSFLMTIDVLSQGLLYFFTHFIEIRCRRVLLKLFGNYSFQSPWYEWKSYSWRLPLSQKHSQKLFNSLNPPSFHQRKSIWKDVSNKAFLMSFSLNSWRFLLSNLNINLSILLSVSSNTLQ